MGPADADGLALHRADRRPRGRHRRADGLPRDGEVRRAHRRVALTGRALVAPPYSPCGSGLALVAFATAAVASRGTAAATLTALALPPGGILFVVHPTAAPIAVAASADAPLEVCELGTTFSTHWRGGCRRLRDGRVALPTSGGGAHVGFRIRPVSGRAVRVARLVVRWHCVDRAFVVRGAPRRIRATFDC